MSYLAAKKAQQKPGPETIFFYAGGTLLIAILIEIVLYWVIHYKFEPSTMIPILYFLFLGGLCLGSGSYIRENPQEALRIMKEWLITVIVTSPLFGAAFGAYIW
jgi:intracellular septation protein A